MQALSTPLRPGAPRLAGWPIVGWIAAGLAVLTLAVFAVAGTGEAGMRLLLRATARTSAVLFSAAFAASALHRRWPSTATRWLLSNRRYLGVSFATSHLVHTGAIAGLARTAAQAPFHMTTIVLGGFGLVVIAAMTATSFDRTAAWLGPRAWRVLHTFGVYYLWLIFMATFVPNLAREWEALPPILLLVGALALRLWPARRR